MLGLVLRKSLVDTWDGLVPIFAGNILVLGLATMVVTALEAAARSNAALLAVVALAGAALLAMTLAAYAVLVAGWVEHRAVDLAGLRQALWPTVLPAGLAALPLTGLAMGCVSWSVGSPTAARPASWLPPSWRRPGSRWPCGRSCCCRRWIWLGRPAWGGGRR